MYIKHSELQDRKKSTIMGPLKPQISSLKIQDYKSLKIQDPRV